MADVTATEKTYDSITLKIINLDPGWNNQTDGGRQIYFYFKGENDADYEEITSKKLTHPKDENGDDITNTETVEYEIPNLKSSTTYQIMLKIYKTGNDGYLLTTLYAAATTYPRVPKISIGNVDDDSMYFLVWDNPFDSSGNVIRGSIYGFYITVTGNDGSSLDFGVRYVDDKINDFESGAVYSQRYNLNYEKYGMSENTTYRIRVCGVKELADKSLYYNTDYSCNIFFTTPKKGAPEKFYWSSYGSIPESGSAVSDVSYAAWNALIDAIDKMIVYKGDDYKGYVPDNFALYGGGGGLEYSEATKYARLDSGDKTLYAYKFNIANYIIQQISGYITFIGDKQSKENCYASYLIALEDNYNKNL